MRARTAEGRVAQSRAKDWGRWARAVRENSRTSPKPENGLPVIRLHDLRHTYATLALVSGIHAKIVSERLGHANIGITLDCYSHCLPTLSEEAATQVAALVVPD